MFQSPYEHPDLIFSDACTQLYKIDTDIESYLGGDVVEVIRSTDPRMCSSATSLSASLILWLSLYTIYMVFF